MRQEMYYHTVIQVHKTLGTGSPVYLYKKLTQGGHYPRDTRQSRTSSIRLGPTFSTRLALTRNSFRWRGAVWYEDLPVEIRKEQKLNSFKKKLNVWVKINIDL